MAVDTRSLRSDLASVCGDWRELDPARDGHHAVDGVLPSLWAEPAGSEELAEVLKLASTAGAAVVPMGGGTRMGVGMPPRAADLLLSTRKLNRVIEYEPADLTVTAEAGIVLGELQRRLASEGQLLALDPPNGDRATLGGVVASNSSGPLRLQYGSARDLVLGTRVANSDGILTRAGGRVVKNVAGYDLNKLYTGSFGTLGVIVELSFKLHPLPQRRGAVLARFGDLRSAAAVVQRVMRSPLGPTSIAVLDSEGSAGLSGVERPAGEGGLLAFLVTGFEKAVARVTGEIAEYCGAGGEATVLEGEDEVAQTWSTIRELADATDPDQPILKIGVPPARSIEALAWLRGAARTAELGARMMAYAGTGLIYARFAATNWDDWQIEGLASLVREGRAFAGGWEGSLVVEAAPVGLKERVDVWGEVGPALRLMRSLKEKLDPTGTLNPGRFVGGI